jgi:hypothetical protein
MDSRRTSTVPDASISASFRYLFEVKTARNAVRRNQLEGHLEMLGAGTGGRVFADERLFVVTPDPVRPSVLDEISDPRALWFNFLQLGQAIDDLLADPTELISEQTRFLLRELQALFAQDGLLDYADVVVIPASKAYPFYLRYGAYICQSGRGFREGLRYIGFYADQVIKPEIPEILKRRDPLLFTSEEVGKLRQDGDEIDSELADVIERVLADGEQVAGEPHQMFLLSRADDPRTMVLPKPIRNTKRDRKGNLWPWAYPQRYTRMAALSAGPDTTDELDEAEARGG